MVNFLIGDRGWMQRRQLNSARLCSVSDQSSSKLSLGDYFDMEKTQQALDP